MAFTAPKTYIAQAVLTAAEKNTYERDNLNQIARVGINGWSPFTPTWTASSSNPAIGNGTLEGRYAQIGHLLIVWVNCIAGSTTTFGSGSYEWATPVTVTTNIPGGANGITIGVARSVQGGLDRNHTRVHRASTGGVALYRNGGTAVTDLNPDTAADGDFWRFSYMIESAS